MKKSLLLPVFLLTFFLYSCSNALPEETNTGDPTATETMSVEISAKEPIDTETMTEETGKENPIAAEAMTIVFMGESIIAPASYPNVPDEYAPVLDDLYLYGELLRRYETLNRHGKITQDIMRECEAAQNEIEQRGYISYPYGGIEGTSGYALVDLDGDNIPELLLLDDTSHDTSRRQAPTIHSIFAIRGGKLVSVEYGSYEFRYATILASDGTFYQYVGYGSAGYAKLTAFRLESGKSEFTIINDARAALSFSVGDIPVPYWVKIENGNEISITEDEFDALLEQYENPKEPMILDFVPLHPGAVDPWSVPRPSENPPIIEVEYPESYQDAPIDYKPVLDTLFLFSELVRREEGFDDLTRETVWGELGFVEWPYGELGYAVTDLNNDDIPELLLGYIEGSGSSEGLNNSAPYSIFTLKSGKPVLVVSFWSRSRGTVAADGTIYGVGSGGAAYTYLSSYRLDKNADTLTQLTDMRSDYSASEEKPYYYKVVDGKNQYISDKEFWAFCEMYDNPPNKMMLKVISINS